MYTMRPYFLLALCICCRKPELQFLELGLFVPGRWIIKNSVVLVTVPILSNEHKISVTHKVNSLVYEWLYTRPCFDKATRKCTRKWYDDNNFKKCQGREGGSFFNNSDTHCLQTSLLIFKFCQPQNVTVSSLLWKEDWKRSSRCVCARVTAWGIEIDTENQSIQWMSIARCV